MSLALWSCKRLQKRIDGYREKKAMFLNFAEEVQGYIYRDEELLKLKLKQLGKDDFIAFGIATGYLSQDDLNKKMEGKPCKKNSK